MKIEDTIPNPERERTIGVAWIFDVDGVITNIEKGTLEFIKT